MQSSEIESITIQIRNKVRQISITLILEKAYVIIVY